MYSFRLSASIALVSLSQWAFCQSTSPSPSSSDSTPTSTTSYSFWWPTHAPYITNDSFYFPVLNYPTPEGDIYGWGVPEKWDPSAGYTYRDIWITNQFTDSTVNTIEAYNDTVVGGGPYNHDHLWGVNHTAPGPIPGTLVEVIDEPEFLLGSNVNFYTSWEFGRIPSVPFGINLGQEGHFNGSITVGGIYDANRVASTQWNILPSPPGSNSTFLNNGTQAIWVCFSPDATSTCSEGTNATVDFNSDSLVLPFSIPCEKDFFVSRVSSDSEDPSHWNPAGSILVPANITSLNAAACRNLEEGDSSLPILGRPFFQATYAYVNRTGAIYVVAANPFNLPVDAKVFDERQTLSPVTSAADRVQTATILLSFLGVSLVSIVTAAL
ncbi:hypothetical protein K402DRAFT_401375 [Aulographum hederae CBS 113979]|uniref:Peptidase A1 domain-containing protein n=1 Tax=Aulographum hederae CBS 113979 TaxID=1176131 RepID=A0A6G1HA08_9PEZI|nr:hypothetical protein K402DRAFT_401375 [Aulographum hederae CBS 113979]